MGCLYSPQKDNSRGFNDKTFGKCLEWTISRIENCFAHFAKLVRLFANSCKSFADFSYSYVAEGINCCAVFKSGFFLLYAGSVLSGAIRRILAADVALMIRLVTLPV